MISTPGGKIDSNQIIRLVPIRLGNIIIKTDLIILPLEGMDIILGMDWMTQHQVILDISSRTVKINSPKYGTTILYLPFRDCINSCAFAMKDLNIKIFLWYASMRMFFRITCLECRQIGMSSLRLNFNLVLPLSPKGRIECHPRSWLN